MREREEVRDLLPELLHGQLSPSEAARVRGAMAADASLAAEYAMLQALRPALTTTPVLDLDAIVAALPAPPSAATSEIVETDEFTRRRLAKASAASTRRAPVLRFARVAAVLAVLVGGSYAVVRARPSAGTPPGADSTLVASGSVQLDLGAAVDGLTEEQLQALEAEIRQLDGLPSADPEVGLEEGA